MSDENLRAPKAPCGSCPYRRDVPSGIWDKGEYAKLPGFDGPTGLQDPSLFMCHQRDGKLCGGWLACHDPRELLALRLAAFRERIDPSVFRYKTDMPVFASGAEARDHGMRDHDEPGDRANKMIGGLLRKRKARPRK